jgi:hypothetical protein
MLFGKLPFKPQFDKSRVSKLEEFAKKLGGMEESSELLSRWSSERKWSFEREEQRGPEIPELDKLKTLRLGSTWEMTSHQLLPCAEMFT